MSSNIKYAPIYAPRPWLCTAFCISFLHEMWTIRHLFQPSRPAPRGHPHFPCWDSCGATVILIWTNRECFFGLATPSYTGTDINNSVQISAAHPENVDVFYTPGSSTGAMCHVNRSHDWVTLKLCTIIRLESWKVSQSVCLTKSDIIWKHHFELSPSVIRTT